MIKDKEIEFARYFFSALTIRQDDNILIVRRYTKLCKYKLLRIFISGVLVISYLGILLSFYIWMIFFAQVPPDIHVLELFLIRVIPLVFIPITISCFWGWFAWMLFNQHDLTINRDDLKYRLKVIITVSEKVITRSGIQSISIREDETGFGIYFETLDGPLYTFHYPRYRRSGYLATDRILYYKKEFEDIEYMIQTIKEFLLT
jgi:hypothetical protein